MRNIIKDILIFTIILFIFYYLFNYNSYISKQVLYSYQIWLKNILPTLFPLFIICDTMKNSSIPNRINKYMNYIYPLSFIFGSPTNAYLLKDYNIDLTKYLSVTKFTSIVFTYTYLTKIFNSKISILLMISNYLTTIILIFLIKPNKLPITKSYIQKNISEYITKSMNTNITILGTIIFFQILPINLINNIYLKAFLKSILEITTSLEYLITAPLPFLWKLFFATISLSTCGLCIDIQMMNIIPKEKIDIKKYLKYRMTHLILFLSINLITIFFY